MVLESYKHEHSCFVTLTYSPEFLPDGQNLVPEDAQKFLKRLRKHYPPKSIRYYLVGEYGDVTQRPHYHLLLYGVPVEDTRVIADCWSRDKKPLGHVVVGTVTFESAGYVAGYVTKKLTRPDDPRLAGRHPEFARMSLRPGIGALAIPDICDTLYTKHGCQQLALEGDVPTVLQHGARKLPLGRYLRGKLREALDIPNLGLSSPAAIRQREELSVLFQDKDVPTDYRKSVYLSQAFSQQIRQIETRLKIHAKVTKI